MKVSVTLHCKKVVVCFLFCNQACSCPRALVKSIVRSHWSRSKVVSFFVSAKSQCTMVSPPAPQHRGLAFTLNNKLWLLDWRSPPKRLVSPLLHSLCSHLFLHAVEVNYSLIKTVPSASISYWTIIIMTCCIFLLLKVNWLCVSQGIYAGPSLGEVQAVNEALGFSLEA